MKLVISAAAMFLFSTASLAKTCEIKVEANDQMQYNVKEIVVEKGCTEVNLTLKATGKLPKSAMGHNIIISTDKDMPAIIADGIKAGLVKDYHVAGDARLVAATKLVGGGESVSTTFKTSALKSGENYVFFCSFPGHSGIMKGTVVIK